MKDFKFMEVWDTYPDTRASLIFVIGLTLISVSICGLAALFVYILPDLWMPTLIIGGIMGLFAAMHTHELSTRIYLRQLDEKLSRLRS